MQQDSLTYQQNSIQTNNNTFFINFVSLQDEIPQNLFVKKKDTIKTKSVLLPQKNIVQAKVNDVSYNKLSLFTQHELKVVNNNPKPVQVVNQDWIYGILIFCIVIITMAKFLFSKRFNQIFKAVFSNRFINQMFREGNLFKERIVIFLFINCVLINSLFIFIVNKMIIKLPIEDSFSINLYLIIIIIFLSLFIYKLIISLIIEKFFKTAEPSFLYRINLFLFNYISGIILLPFLILIICMNSLTILYLCIGLYFLIILYRITRIIIIKTLFSFLHLFLYICTLEILPLLVIIKIIDLLP